jgi:phosphate transport system permease protein
MTPGSPATTFDTSSRNLGDRAFRSVALGSGITVLLILALIAVSTTSKAWPALSHEGFGFVTSNRWIPNENHFGALALIYGTLMSSLIALLFAVPVSLGIALFVTELAPPKLAAGVNWFIDVLAAIPSVVYGLWAVLALAQPIGRFYARIGDATASIPILNTLFGGDAQGRSIMTAGLILAIMIVPIITSLSRDALLTVPTSDKAAALAVGATRWEALRVSVFPRARGGIVAAVMLGLGRALGETIAVALVMGSSAQITAHLFSPGASMAGTIANEFGEATGLHNQALVGLGVVLFAITMVVNGSARWFVRRSDRKLYA